MPIAESFSWACHHGIADGLDVIHEAPLERNSVWVGVGAVEGVETRFKVLLR